MYHKIFSILLISLVISCSTYTANSPSKQQLARLNASSKTGVQVAEEDYSIQKIDGVRVSHEGKRGLFVDGGSRIIDCFSSVTLSNDGNAFVSADYQVTAKLKGGRIYKATGSYHQGMIKAWIQDEQTDERVSNIASVQAKAPTVFTPVYVPLVR